MNRSPTQVAMYSSPKESSAPISASDAIAAASGHSEARSAGTSTSSTTDLKSQISTASIAGNAAANASPTSQRLR